MKEIYTPVVVKIIVIKEEDIITTSVLGSENGFNIDSFSPWA